MQARLWGPLSRLGLLMAVWVFAADQLSKYWVLRIINLDERPPIQITTFADLAMAWNEGVSYGLLTTHAQMVLVMMSLLITVVLWIWLARASHPVAAVSLGLVIGGALGNALDRVLYGAVADFVHLHWGSWSWYIFNVADIAVTVGFILILLGYKKVFKKTEEENAAQVIDYQLANTNETITETFRDNSNFENPGFISEEKVSSDSEEIIGKEHKIIPPNHDETKS
jgi:signal peptidase II